MKKQKVKAYDELNIYDICQLQTTLVDIVLIYVYIDIYII